MKIYYIGRLEQIVSRDYCGIGGSMQSISSAIEEWQYKSGITSFVSITRKYIPGNGVYV